MTTTSHGESAGSFEDKSLVFQRSVSQLLFNYLPDRTVDWEDGAMVVQLERARLSSVWPPERSSEVLRDVDEYLNRWLKNGGQVRAPFPTRGEVGRFAVGEPRSISARFLHTALVCTNCLRLVFRSESEMIKSERQGTLRVCPECGRHTLRQFPQVLVHGCGRLDPITRFLPWMKRSGDRFEASKKPIQCPNCGDKERLFLPSRSERARDMKIYCRNCGFEVGVRLAGRCVDCVKDLKPRDGTHGLAGAASDEIREPTAVAKVAMRLTRYSASDAYFPHTLTRLRTDLTRTSVSAREAARMLQVLVDDKESYEASIEHLAQRMQEAAARGDLETVQSLSEAIRSTLSGAGQKSVPTSSRQFELDDETRLAVRDAIAFDCEVRTTPAIQVARQNSTLPAHTLLQQAEILERLGINEMSLVHDLPIITATFGYSRRSPDPTYEEHEVAKGIPLPTTIRPFPPLDRMAVNAVDRPDLLGATPILAREGKHQGLFFSLDPERVIQWLETNEITLPVDAETPLLRIVTALEPIDRFYDKIWSCRVRRFVFGVVHSLSHVFMRAISRYAGLERTSIGEYVILPLLGSVIYDNSSVVNLGAIETAMRNDLAAILDSIQNEAMSCIYDVDCRDRRKGACHGCIHAPEICCRVFNHGLSRSFLLGGHAPWASSARDDYIKGYWEQ